MSHVTCLDGQGTPLLQWILIRKPLLITNLCYKCRRNTRTKIGVSVTYANEGNGGKGTREKAGE